MKLEINNQTHFCLHELELGAAFGCLSNGGVYIKTDYIGHEKRNLITCVNVCTGKTEFYPQELVVVHYPQAKVVLD